MDYELDITNSYLRFICLDNSLMIDSYYSFDLMKECAESFTVNLENIEVQMIDSIWYAPIHQKNPNGIISRVLGKLDLDALDTILTVLLKKAKLIIKEPRSMHLKLIHKNEEIHHTVDSDFSVGDKSIWIAGKSADYADTDIKMEVIFSGELKFLFEESDILIELVNLEGHIPERDVGLINKYQDLMVRLKNRPISELKVNNVSSKFLDFYFLRSYFESSKGCKVAKKSYQKS